MILFLMWLWQMPQHLAGKIVSMRWKKIFKTLTVEERTVMGRLEGKYNCKIYIVNRNEKQGHWFWQFISGFSSGKRVKLTDAHDELTVQHEIGHSRQSLRLGWFYIPVVGVWSAVFCNLWQRIFHRGWHPYDRAHWYYLSAWAWTEQWADALAGITQARKERIARLFPKHTAHTATRFPEIKTGGAA